MALYRYQAKTPEGETKAGTIEAASLELAVSSLQLRGLVIIALEPAEGRMSWWQQAAASFERVKSRDIVVLSRQFATLFEAKVPVVQALRVLIDETSNQTLKKHLSEVLSDIQGGISVSSAMSKHPQAFSNFYVNMVRSGEESGKLEEIFGYLADYLERSYDLATKAPNALIYPAFILSAFIVIITLMLVVVIPQLSSILSETGQEVPIYTRIVIGFSNFLREFGVFLIVLPFFRMLYRKIYLSRLTDNLQTLLAGGVVVLLPQEISADVFGNEFY